MKEETKPIDHLLHDLRERAKELNCLYEVQEILNNPDLSIDDVCHNIVRILPPGWQYPDICQAEISFAKKIFHTEKFEKSPWVQAADILVQEEKVGRISIYYSEERPLSDEGPFLNEERRLINTIAQELGFYILHQQLKRVFQEQQRTEEGRMSEWQIILDLLKRTDPDLLTRIARKMIIYLGWNGFKEAEQMLEKFSQAAHEMGVNNQNHPTQGESNASLLEINEEVFAIASKYLPRDVILDNIQRWSEEDRVNFLVNTLADPSSTFLKISSAIERYHLLVERGLKLTSPRERWLCVALLQRIMSDQPDFVSVAKKHITIDDLSDLMRRIVFPASSHGKLGGKSSGLFLAAKILHLSSQAQELLKKIKTPKTWYLTSDSVFYFMWYNNLEDFIDQRYKDISQVRQEYPYITHVFKNSMLPPEIVKGLSLALDDLGNVPLIVRSSSLLEDQSGVAFAGKYKSLFIANMGSKEERLAALMDAVVEVLASQFGPDPIEYRTEHNLIDHNEEIGIMIQEVVGSKIGHYYMPSFAGVAFSINEFRWSSRLKGEDGLIRLVPGLGTRAVDRMSDDYPVLISPGQPGLRVNVSSEEIVRYSPQKIDVINLETRRFETVEIRTILQKYGHEYPLVEKLLSIVEDGQIRKPARSGVDFKRDNYFITCEGLCTQTTFLKQVKKILDTLKQTLGYSVDIEFAHDGTNFYLLQCRPQSQMPDQDAPVLPVKTPPERILFTASRFIPNGIISDISHIVYVDPDRYDELEQYQDLFAVGRAIGNLNRVLPKRRFILMGPGRWGSRGDIKLGVSVTYADISNTALLVEIAKKNKNYAPEPSFGTHFFLDLVESSIRYLPLFPDEPDIIFNEHFLIKHENVFPKILPGFAHLKEVIRVIDIPKSANGQVLQVIMNADQEKAIALLTPPLTSQ